MAIVTKRAVVIGNGEGWVDYDYDDASLQVLTLRGGGTVTTPFWYQVTITAGPLAGRTFSGSVSVATPFILDLTPFGLFGTMATFARTGARYFSPPWTVQMRTLA